MAFLENKEAVQIFEELSADQCQELLPLIVTIIPIETLRDSITNHLPDVEIAWLTDELIGHHCETSKESK